MVKMRRIPLARGLAIAAVCLLSLSTVLSAQVQHYKQTNLVADTTGVAPTTDPNLVNPWGLSRSSGSPWWVSDNGTGLSTLYSGTGAAASLVVTIPPADSSSGQSGTPTGQVFNGTTGFELAPGFPAKFIFVTEDGTVSGWNPGVNATTAVIKVNTNSASVYKGAALALVGNAVTGSKYNLYVADFRKGHVDVFDSTFQRITLPGRAFVDSMIPKGFAPFNIQNIGGNLYVAYAAQDSALHDEIDGPGLGYVDVFTPRGALVMRFQHGDWLNAPWGLAQAPSDFGAYSHDILIGQFGSGQILAFDPLTGHFRGRLLDATAGAITIGGLWGLSFGSGTGSGPANSLYFTAGSDGEQHGLFGTITPIENDLGGDH